MMNILYIAVVAVFVIDIAGAGETLKDLIFVIRGKRPDKLHPFDCSLCTTFWLGLGYIVFSGLASWGNFAAVCLAASMTTPIAAAIGTFRDTAIRLLRKLNNLIR